MGSVLEPSWLNRYPPLNIPPCLAFLVLPIPPSQSQNTQLPPCLGLCVSLPFRPSHKDQHQPETTMGGIKAWHLAELSLTSQEANHSLSLRTELHKAQNAILALPGAGCPFPLANKSHPAT